jgi:hypothetical protein
MASLDTFGIANDKMKKGAVNTSAIGRNKNDIKESEIRQLWLSIELIIDFLMPSVVLPKWSKNISTQKTNPTGSKIILKMIAKKNVNGFSIQ